MINSISQKIQNDNFINLIRPYVSDIDCFLVGGYIRDLFFDEYSHDRDLIVNSDNAEITAKKIADHTDSHFIVLDEKNKIYRVVMPDKINYFDISAMLDDDLKKDINRRDLTINSMVYDINRNRFIEGNDLPFRDFEQKVLRTFSLQNFIDDPLRMLRVYRFVAKYNFSIASEITDFIDKNKKLIKNPAKERINTELMKLFEGKYSNDALLKMDETGLLSVLFPVMEEVKKIPPNIHHHLNLFYHQIETVRQIQRNYENLDESKKNYLKSFELGNYSRLSFLKLAGFLHDIGKPETWTIEEDTGRHRFIKHDEVGSKKVVPILKELKFSKKQINYVQNMIKYHIYPSALVWQETVGSKARLKYFRKMYPFFLDNIILAMSDRLSALGKDITCEIVVKNISDLNILLQECFEFDEVEAMPKPFLNGTEIMEITHLCPSKELGYIVKSIYQMQLDGDILSKEDALKFLKDKSNIEKIINDNNLNTK